MNIQNTTNTNFYGIPKAKYKLPNGENIKIIELDKNDLKFISKLSNDIVQFMDKHEIETITDKRLIIDTSFKVIKEILENFNKIGKKDKKTRMFIAECDSDICGVLVGGLPKKKPNGDLVFSSRKDATKNETELNWLATWTPNSKIKRKGVGKVLMSEYMNTFDSDGVRQAFIQSEIPKLSFAQKFYESLGFEAMKCGQKPHSQVEINKDTVHCVEDLYDYEVVPMLGDITKINSIKNQIFKDYERTPINDKPINLFKYIEIFKQ